VDRKKPVFREKTHLSSPILPIQGPPGPSSPTGSGRTEAGDPAAFLAALATGDRGLSIEATRGGPPPEVLDQVAAAAAFNEQLRVNGQEIRFRAPDSGGRVSIEVHDKEGGTVRTISVAEAIELAAGRPLG